MEIAEFLLARIDEDEQGAEYRHTDQCRLFRLGYDEGWCDCDYPARVLSECEAKRRIVGDFGSQCSDYGPPGSDLRRLREALATELGVQFQPHYPEEFAPFCDGCAAAQSADNGHLWVLRLLATPYASHPDFREEWRP